MVLRDLEATDDQIHNIVGILLIFNRVEINLVLSDPGRRSNVLLFDDHFQELQSKIRETDATGKDRQPVPGRTDSLQFF